MPGYLSRHSQPEPTEQVLPNVGHFDNLLPPLDPDLPREFIESSHQVAEYIGSLDDDPALAIEQQPIRTFVQQLAGTGFIGGVHSRARGAEAAARGGFMPLFEPVDPRQALPAWLQLDFLAQHDITGYEPLSDIDMEEVGTRFDRATTGFAFTDRPDGRYFTVDRESVDAVPITQYSKYYVESDGLLRLLREDKLQQVLDDLGQHGVSPYEFKMYEDDRLVFYFAHAGSGAADEIRSVFLADDTGGRGPAQDVFEVVQADDGLDLEPWASNDAALGDAGRNRVEYTALDYDPKAFTEMYIQHCLFSGKDPAEPYATNFVYFLAAHPESIDPGLVSQAARLTGYPILVAPSRLGA